MTSFEGDTGPYLQYAHARLCSMTRKSELNVDELPSANFDLLTEPHAIDLIRLLASWPDVLINTSKTLEPITVLAYLFRMTHMLSSSYDVLKVIGSEPDVKKARMALYAAARQVLHNGMRVLGLNPVERYVGLTLVNLSPLMLITPAGCRFVKFVPFPFPDIKDHLSSTFHIYSDAFGAQSWKIKFTAVFHFHFALILFVLGGTNGLSWQSPTRRNKAIVPAHHKKQIS